MLIVWDPTLTPQLELKRRDKGWLDSDYFYPVRLNPLKKVAGRYFDSAQAWKTRKRKNL